MICPNCDNVINATGCQACGWKTGDPFPVHRLAPNSSHPLKEGVGIYPPRIGGPRAIQIVAQDDPGDAQIMTAAFEPESTTDQMIVPEPVLIGDPGVRPEGSDDSSGDSALPAIPDPVSTTVQ